MDMRDFGGEERREVYRFLATGPGRWLSLVVVGVFVVALVGYLVLSLVGVV